MLWTDLNNKTIGIWGMGREGQAAKAALECHVSGLHLLEITEENTAEISKCTVLIKSPGVSLYRPEIQQAIQQGISVTSGTNLFFANKKKEIPVIAVTGTKGKSTTASLLAHVLKGLGKSVLLGGNIGKPLIDFVDESADFIVAELSSYQCADLKGRPDIGIITNLYPEHLQWHLSHDNYYRDKMRLVTQSNQSVLNGADKRLEPFIGGENIHSFNTKTDIHVQDDLFYDGDQPLFPIQSLPLLGRHNAENACAVLTVIRLLGMDLKACQNIFPSFEPLPHRLQILGTKEGLTYVDDSISTTPETAIAALRALDKGQFITLIAGGFDRGQDYTDLIAFLKDYRDRISLVTLPETGTRLTKQAQEAGIKASPTSDMPTAVSVAQHLTLKGGTILLSPAAPSYNLYKNFEERGDDFKYWAGFQN